MNNPQNPVTSPDIEMLGICPICQEYVTSESLDVGQFGTSKFFHNRCKKKHGFKYEWQIFKELPNPIDLDSDDFFGRYGIYGIYTSLETWSNLPYKHHIFDVWKLYLDSCKKQGYFKEEHKKALNSLFFELFEIKIQFE